MMCEQYLETKFIIGCLLLDLTTIPKKFHITKPMTVDRYEMGKTQG